MSREKLQASYQEYLKVLREIEGKWFDNTSLKPWSLEEHREILQEGAANLAGADLRDMDLRGYDLSWCNLRGANLDRTDLRDSHLVHTDLTDAHLIGADLRGANLEKAYLDCASLYGALIEQKNLDAAGAQIPDYQKQSLTGPFTGLPSLSLDEWGAIVQFYQKRCAYCGGPYETIDHFLPLSQGGETWVGNVVPACFACAYARRDGHPNARGITAKVMERITADLKRRVQSDEESFSSSRNEVLVTMTPLTGFKERMDMTTFLQLRIQASLSLGQAAKRAGVRAEVERRANRGIPLSRRDAEKLARALGELLGRELPPELVEELVAGKSDRQQS